VASIKTFMQNTTVPQTNRALLQKYKGMTGVITLLFHQSMSYKISRLLGKFNIKVVHVRAKKSVHMLRSMKGGLKLKVSGLCSITYECGKVYIGQPG
jgi:hypothetical protein